MRWAGWLVVLILPLVAGCAETEKDWMKINQPYTAEEFRRDLSECTRGGRLDEGCMRNRGWVSVNPGKESKPAEPTRPVYSPRR